MPDPYLDALEQLDQMRDRAFKAEDAIAGVRALAEQARTVIARGCTCCGDDCTGCRRGEPMGWDLDPAQVLAVLAALDGEK